MIENRSVPAATVIPVLAYADAIEAADWIRAVWIDPSILVTLLNNLSDEFAAVSPSTGVVGRCDRKELS